MLQCVEKAHHFGVFFSLGLKLLLEILHPCDSFFGNIEDTLCAVFLTATANRASAIALHEFVSHSCIMSSSRAPGSTFDFFCRQRVQAFRVRKVLRAFFGGSLASSRPMLLFDVTLGVSGGLSLTSVACLSPIIGAHCASGRVSEGVELGLTPFWAWSCFKNSQARSAVSLLKSGTRDPGAFLWETEVGPEAVL